MTVHVYFPASVLLDSDSFHPLLAEVTHNETAEPSMIFHLPDHDGPTSPEGQPACGESRGSASSEEFEAHADSSVESEPSPERLREEEPSGCAAVSPASHDSSSQLITSDCHPDESVLMLSPAADVELTALSLSRLTMCDDATRVDMPLPEGAAADGNHVWPFSYKILVRYVCLYTRASSFMVTASQLMSKRNTCPIKSIVLSR